MKHRFYIAHFFDAYDELTPTHVSGHLYFSYDNISSLGNLTAITGDLDIIFTKISSFGPLTDVGGILVFHGTSITSLGNLQRVNGNLFLNQFITSLENLECVGDTVYCVNRQQHDILSVNNKGRFKLDVTMFYPYK